MTDFVVPHGFQNGIRGWFFTENEINDAKINGKMLMLDFEVGYKCSLNCPFCFRKEDHRDLNYPILSIDQTKDIIDQAKLVGCKSIHIVGQGEPTECNYFFDIMEYIHYKKMIPLIYTSGLVLGNDELAKKYHKGMTGEEMVKRLFRLDASVIIKLNSFDKKIQDKIVGNPNQRDIYGTLKRNKKLEYSKYRDIALKRLIDVGFNNQQLTRLGADILILKNNYDEVFDLYKYCRENFIYPVVVTFIPCGKTAKENARNNFDVDDYKKIELWNKIYSYNRKIGIPFDGVSSYAGGLVCHQLEYALYVNIEGLVYRCPGALENIGQLVGPGCKNLKKIWNRCREAQNGSICSPRVRAGSLPGNLRKVVEKHLEETEIESQMKSHELVASF